MQPGLRNMPSTYHSSLQAQVGHHDYSVYHGKKHWQLMLHEHHLNMPVIHFSDATSAVDHDCSFASKENQFKHFEVEYFVIL